MSFTIPADVLKSLKNYQAHGIEIRTRMPPQPSGHLHIGHAKALLYNYLTAKQFNGKMILRMDDTNPTKESVEYTDSIIDDIQNIMKITPDMISHSSDYFDTILEYGDKLVADGLAYVDT